jgi:hypothetical protein
MIVVIGLSLIVLILSSSGWPQPGCLVSTTVSPFAVANTAVLPPPPRMTHKLSFTFSTVRLSTDGCGAGCCAATTTVRAPARTSVPRTAIRFTD